MICPEFRISPAQLLWRITQGGLLEAFLDRDARFAPILKSFPLIVVTNDQLGLLGARQYALKLLDPSNEEVRPHLLSAQPCDHWPQD